MKTFEEVASHPKVQKMVNKFVSIQRDDVAKAFYRTWSRHYNAWGCQERQEQHSLENISRLSWDRNEKCFKVYYKKTKHFAPVWYHYTLSGQWY